MDDGTPYGSRRRKRNYRGGGRSRRRVRGGREASELNAQWAVEEAPLATRHADLTGGRALGSEGTGGASAACQRLTKRLAVPEPGGIGKGWGWGWEWEGELGRADGDGHGHGRRRLRGGSQRADAR
ncbi:hypothetical protein SEVIR_2G365450v4 [Setaria viridis]